MDYSKREIVTVIDSLGQTITFYCEHAKFTAAYLAAEVPYLQRPYTVKYGFEIIQYFDVAIFTAEKRENL